MPLPSHGIPRILWNLSLHYSAHRNPPLALIINRISPIHAFPSYFFKIHFNIMLQSTSRFSKRSPSCSFISTRMLFGFFSFPIHDTLRLYDVRIEWVTRLALRGENKSPCLSWCSFMLLYVTVAFLGSHVFLSNLLSSFQE
jgi:hypothetical protein